MTIKNIPVGYKDSALGIIPMEWEVKRLGEVLSIGNGKDYKHLSVGHIPVFGTGGIITYVDNYLYNGDTVCIGRKGTINKPIFYSGKIWTVDTLFYTYAFKTTFARYIYLLFQIIDWKKYNEATGVPSLSKSTIERIMIPLPPLAEQEKIAEILSTWDKAIEKQTQLIQKLELRKKGLMQQLLTGKKRLPGFTGEWKKVKLGEICDIATGKLDANAMEENGIYPFFTCAKEIYRINRYAFDTEALLVSGNGEYVGYIHYCKGKFNAYQRTYVLDKFKTEILFVKFALQYHLPKRVLQTKSNSNTPYIVIGTLQDMIIPKPSLQEQIAIVNILSSCDEEIRLAQDKLAAMKEQKKGLMQVLLTGKRRVKL